MPIIRVRQIYLNPTQLLIKQIRKTPQKQAIKAKLLAILHLAPKATNKKTNKITIHNKIRLNHNQISHITFLTRTIILRITQIHKTNKTIQQTLVSTLININTAVYTKIQ